MLQVIKAEDVRDGEPRWWCPDDAYAARTLEWIVTGNLHTEWRREADAFTLAIVDRPAPTPTPAPGLDLDAVEAAVAHLSGPSSLFDERTLARVIEVCNAAPALLAEVRRLRVQVDEREADMHMRIRAGYDKTVADAWRAEVAKRDAEIADLRALVESQRRDYLDVCDAIAPETSGPADAAAKVRALRAMVERHGEHLRAGADAVRSANASTAEIGARMEAAGEEIEALRAKLAEATSLLRSAGDLFVEIQTTDGEDEHKAITDGAKLSAAIAAALEAL